MQSQSVLQPIHSFVASDLGGEVERITAAAVNPAAPTVFVAGNAKLVDLAQLFATYAHWVAIGVGAIVAIVALLLAVRVLRRPQKRGVPYCRRCNYDLSAQPAGSELCPECGRLIVGRNARRGRSKGRRLVPPTAVVVALLVPLAIGTVALRRAGAARRVSFPSLTATNLAARFGVRLPWQFQSPVFYIGEFDMRSGALLRRYRPDIEYVSWIDPQLAVSPSGDRIAIKQLKSLALIAAADGEELASCSIQPAEDEYRFSKLVGFGADEHRVLVTSNENDAASLKEWDVASGKARTLFEVGYSRPQAVWISDVARLDTRGGPFAIALGCQDFPKWTWRCLIHDVAAGADTDVALPGVSSEGSLHIAGSPADSTLWCSTSDGIAAVDMPTRAVRKMPKHPLPRPVEAMAASRDGKQVVVAWRRSLAVLDVESATWIATAEYPHINDVHVEYSSDSRYVMALEVVGGTSSSRPVHIWEAPSAPAPRVADP